MQAGAEEPDLAACADRDNQHAPAHGIEEGRFVRSSADVASSGPEIPDVLHMPSASRLSAP